MKYFTLSATSAILLHQAKAEHGHAPPTPASVFEAGALNIASSKFSYKKDHMGPGRLRTTASRHMPDLLTVDYGCFCRDLIRVTADFKDPIDWYSNIGHPVNEIDRVCKSLMDGYVCLKNSGIDISQRYISPGKSVFTVEEAVSECVRLNHDPNVASLCSVEEKFAVHLVNLILVEGQNMDPAFNPIENESDRRDICHPGNNNGYGASVDRVVPIVFCCDQGRFPEKSVVANTADKCDEFYVPEEEEKTYEEKLEEHVGEFIEYNDMDDYGFDIYDFDIK